MTLLDDPPVATESPSAGRASMVSEPAAWRCAARLARRETRRRPGRTVLVALLIAAPVLAMTIGAVLVRTDADDWVDRFERSYGAVDVVVNPAAFGFATDGGIAASSVEVPPGTVVDDYLWTNTAVTPAEPAEPGIVYWGVFTDLVLVEGADQPIEIIDGRAPVDGEILLDRDTAEQFGVRVGDDVVLERPSGTWTLSGIGRMRDAHWERIVDIPGFDRSRMLDDASQITTTYRFPDGMSDDDVRRFAVEVGGVTTLDDPYFDGSNTTAAIAWGWVGGAVALVAVGIIVAAAFATSARRQLVTVGQLSANGATSRVVRRTLALQGTWTGLIGGLLGLVVGLAALPFLRPWAERVFQRDLPAYSIAVGDLVLIVATATIAATIAAAVPARSASRIPVMVALAGRRPTGRLPRWLVPTGIALVGGGLGLMALATVAARNSTSAGVFALLTVVGLVAVVFGMCCATPFVVERVGGLGRRSSLSWRLAARSLTRSRTRSSAVIAAIAVAVGGSVAAAALVETTMAEDQASWRPTLPADTVLVQRWDDAYLVDEETDGLLDPEQPADAAVPTDIRRSLLGLAEGAVIESVRTATFDPAPFDPEMVDPYLRSGRGPLIADDAVIRSIGLHPDDLTTLRREGSLRPRTVGGEVYVAGEFGVELVSGDVDGPPVVYDAAGGEIVVPAPIAAHPMAFEQWQYGTVLMTEQAARDLGFEVADWGALVRYESALTPTERDEVADIDVGLRGGVFDAFVEPGDPIAVDERGPESSWGISYDDPSWRDQRADDVWIARTIVVGAALLLSLLVVSIGLSLAAAEGRDERNTLAVVGAPPASMRRQAAARAAVLAGSGIALGVPTGFVPTWVLYRIANSGDRYGDTLGVPWLVIASLVVGVPLLAGAVAFIASGVGQRLRPPTPTRHD